MGQPCKEPAKAWDLTVKSMHLASCYGLCPPEQEKFKILLYMSHPSLEYAS